MASIHRMPLRYINRIIDHLSYDGYRPDFEYARLRRMLRIDHQDKGTFEDAISEAQTSGLIEIGKDGGVRLPTLPDEIVGKFRSNKRGFGFVSPSQRYREGDIYISSGSEGDAVSGDTVRVAISRSGQWKKNKGKRRKNN